MQNIHTPASTQTDHTHLIQTLSAMMAHLKALQGLVREDAAEGTSTSITVADITTIRNELTTLEQLTRETQALQREVRKGVLRVQLPPPRWLEPAARREADDPLKKYKDLDPRARTVLEPPGKAANSQVSPATKIIFHCNYSRSMEPSICSRNRTSSISNISQNR